MIFQHQICHLRGNKICDLPLLSAYYVYGTMLSGFPFITEFNPHKIQQSSYLWFYFPQFQLPEVNRGPEEMILLLMTHDKFNSSSTLRQNADIINLTSPHHAGILPSYIITGRVRRGRYGRETTFIYLIVIALLYY